MVSLELRLAPDVQHVAVGCKGILGKVRGFHHVLVRHVVHRSALQRGRLLRRQIPPAAAHGGGLDSDRQVCPGCSTCLQQDPSQTLLHEKCTVDAMQLVTPLLWPSNSPEGYSTLGSLSASVESWLLGWREYSFAVMDDQ